MPPLPDLPQLLNEAGLRRTPARLAVLSYLAAQPRPVGVERILAHVPGVNTATVYRMMADFSARGLVAAHDVGHGHTDYEFAKRPHHHHLVCDGCGLIEDAYPCAASCAFERAALKASKTFARITRQSVVFYGTCRACERAGT